MNIEEKKIKATRLDELTDEDLKRRDRLNYAVQILTYNVWFEYKRALEIFDEFDIAYLQACRYYENPEEYTDIRPISLFLVGKLNTGKTTLINKYEHYAEKIAKIEGRHYSKNDIIIVDAPVGITFKGMFAALLAQFGIDIPWKKEIHTDRVIDLLIQELRKRKVKLLFIDDIQNMVNTNQADRNDIFDGFRKIANLSQTRLILVGLPTAYKLFADSNWVDERFRALVLPEWDARSKEYIDLLYTIRNAYGDFLPDWDIVNQEGKMNKEIALFLHSLSEGRLGKLIQTIQQAAVRALTCNRTNILREDYTAVQTLRYFMKDGQILTEKIENY